MRAPGKKFSALFDIGETIEINKVDSKTSHHCLNKWYLSCSGTTGIFFKADIFRIMKSVFDFPVTSDDMKKGFGINC